MCEQSRACCPTPKIVEEKICGNFATAVDPLTVWTTNENNYISGTFEVYNSASTSGNATMDVTSNPDIAVIQVPPGTTMSVSAQRPTAFTISAPLAGANGTYCITLYKRVLA
ncbi:S-Ena type endospore appendage [Bacillus cereus]|uniref:S-Ena type endospore appendage n=1 Tax=Bacillus cereus TaxID=1396 RepID=UPI000BF254B6|nr:S-Ena type endospore appendage [Bacillus cereus]PEQ68076.1 hypothetical protein CN469_04335 [Bacillus cereus]